MEFRFEEITFRKAILQFLGVQTQKDIEDKYCEACMKAFPDKDCSTCSRDITYIEPNKEKGIGR